MAAATTVLTGDSDTYPGLHQTGPSNPALFVMSNGDLLLLYVVGMYVGYSGFGTLAYKVSTDGGATWSAGATLDTVNTFRTRWFRAIPDTSTADTLYLASPEATFGGTNFTINLRTITFNTVSHAISVSGTAVSVPIGTTTGMSNVKLAEVDLVNIGANIHLLLGLIGEAYTTGKPAYRSIRLFSFAKSTWGTVAPAFSYAVHEPGWIEWFTYLPIVGSHRLFASKDGTGLIATYGVGKYNPYDGTWAEARDTILREFTVGASSYTPIGSDERPGGPYGLCGSRDQNGDLDLFANVGNYILHLKRIGTGTYGSSVTYMAAASANFWQPLTRIDSVLTVDAGQYRTVFVAMGGGIVNLLQRSGADGTWVTGDGSGYVYVDQSNYPSMFPQATWIALSRNANGTTVGMSGTTARIAFAYQKTSGAKDTDPSYPNNVIYGYNLDYYGTNINSAPSVGLVAPESYSLFDQTTDTITFSWSVTDPDDSNVQSSYEAIIEENVDGAVTKWMNGSGGVATTQQIIASATTQTTITAGTLAATPNGYRWKVRASDAHGAWGPFSAYNTFSVSAKPVATVTGPAEGSTVNTNHPTITWSYSDAEANPQADVRVRIYDSFGNGLYDSGPIPVSPAVASGSTGSWVLAYGLTDLSTYLVSIQAKDSTGRWSSESATVQFTTWFDYPASPTVSASINANGSATVSITDNSTTPAVAFHSLYRWKPSKSQYVLIASSLSPTSSYIDYGTPANATFHYKVVSYTGSGLSIETLSNDVIYELAGGSDDWSLVQDGVAYGIEVVDITSTTPAPNEEFEPLGRDRKVVVVFDHAGQEGELTVYVPSDGRSIIQTIKKLTGNTKPLYLKSPFGDVLIVKLGTLSKTDLVGGAAQLTIPYTEVDEA